MGKRRKSRKPHKRQAAQQNRMIDFGLAILSAVVAELIVEAISKILGW